MKYDRTGPVKSKHFGIRICGIDFSRLKKIAVKQNISVANLIRIAITDFLGRTS